MGGVNDEVSSVEINGTECILLSKDHTFKGSWLFISEDIPSLSSVGFNDITSSYVVFDGSNGCNESSIALMYYDANGKGGKFPIVPESNNPTGLGYFNDKASSLYVPNGMSVTLFKHGGLEGSCKKFEGNNAIINLEDYGFNDKTSSFAVNYYGNCDSSSGGGGGKVIH